MLCEGIYLHTLIVVAVFAEKQHLMWYYLLGWGESLPKLHTASSSVGINLMQDKYNKAVLNQKWGWKKIKIKKVWLPGLIGKLETVLFPLCLQASR